MRYENPVHLWPGRVELLNGSYVVDQQWAVMETGQRWEAWPYPQCVSATFDDEAYRAECLRGKGLDRSSAVERIRDLIGDPR